MPARQFETVDEYLAAQPEAAGRVLRRLRNAIRKAVPRAQETIAYNMPTYRLAARTVLHFAGWKQYYSVYPINARLLAAFKGDLAPYRFAKSSLHFPYDRPVPVGLIARLVKFRADEIVANPGTRRESLPQHRRR